MFGWTEKSAADATASTAARMPAASGASKSSAAAAASTATDDASAGVDESDEMLSMPINTKVVTSTDLYVDMLLLQYHVMFSIAILSLMLH